MRWMLIVLVLLGLLVAGLGVFEHAIQFSQWSSLVTWAQDAGVPQNEEFARRFLKRPRSPVPAAIIAVGVMITLLAMWRLSIQDRAKQ